MLVWFSGLVVMVVLEWVSELRRTLWSLNSPPTVIPPLFQKRTVVLKVRGVKCGPSLLWVTATPPPHTHTLHPLSWMMTHQRGAADGQAWVSEEPHKNQSMSNKQTIHKRDEQKGQNENSSFALITNGSSTFVTHFSSCQLTFLVPPCIQCLY